MTIPFAQVWLSWQSRQSPRRSLALLVALAYTAASAVPAHLALASSDETNHSDASAVAIPDAALRKAIEDALGKEPGATITRGDMATLRSLGDVRDVGQLTGIEHAINLQVLVLRRGAISDLAPLEAMKSLRWLDLQLNMISDVSPLAQITSLTTLSVKANAISDVSPLAGMTLSDLDLSYNDVSNLRPLAGIKSLTRLYLSANGISDISALAGMTLTRLTLSNNAISDVSPLAGMTSLRELRLESNDLSDLRPLGGLESLTLLDLYNNGISDLSGLGSLTSLTFLDLEHNEVVDLAALSGLTSLEKLRLVGNSIWDVAPLTSLTSLTELELAENKIWDVSAVSNLTSLTSLTLSLNAISDLTPLEGLTSLASLALSANAISDLSPLQGLTSLASLDLSHNRISDLAPLVTNSGLEDGDSIDLVFNPLGVESRETHIPTLLGRGVAVEFDEVAEVSEIRDAGLRRAAEWAWSTFGSDLDTMRRLDASNLGIENLTGIEGATQLRLLFLDDNKITDIAPLAGLRLYFLSLSRNMVQDWGPLAGLDGLDFLALDGNSLTDLPPLPSALYYLYLTDNSISDIASLANRSLIELQLDGNSVTSLAPLSRHSRLQYLHVNDNEVPDISFLNFESLRELHVRNNAVQDISPLLDGDELLMVDVRRNPLADDALAVVETLRERGVTVLAGEATPYFPAAGGNRQGFVRVVNRSDADGHVFIEAVDDAGVRAGPLRMDVGARRAVHLNSTDLEHGSAAKGISGGVGAPTEGDWRLEVISALDVEVLSYIRTEDGFVTAMHDVAADAMAPFFNPGSNRNQRSILRVVNTEAEPAKWTTGGYADDGKWHPMAGSLLVRPQHALTLTAQALEDEHGLGDGRGKWRLRVRGFPWFAMSLLESPTGHLTNLSTAPDNATPLEGGATLHRLPLFPAAGGARQGFVRVINRSYVSGEVAIEAVDDSGNRAGPVLLSLRPRRVAHFNSADLENGNAAKGLDGAVGVGEGDWRLEVTSELDLTVLCYARTADGFLTSLHDVAPREEDDALSIPFFNPGANRSQVSHLRLMNWGDAPAEATITGIDDAGRSPGEAVRVTIPARAARTFTAAELETGNAGGLSGALGDGQGKWRLHVATSEEVEEVDAMSLMSLPTGHMTNLSTTPRYARAVADGDESF